MSLSLSPNIDDKWTMLHDVQIVVVRTTTMHPRIVDNRTVVAAASVHDDGEDLTVGQIFDDEDGEE